MGIFTALFFSILSFAGDCESVDFREALGPPLNQGNTGYCFAHSSADMISQRVGYRVSAFDLASHFLLGDVNFVNDIRDPDLRRFLDENPDFVPYWRKIRNEEPNNYSAKRILSANGLFNTGGDEVQTIFAANHYGLCLEERLPSGAKKFESYLRSIQRFHRQRLNEGSWWPDEMENPFGEVLEPEARLAAHSYQIWVDKKCDDRVMPHALVPGFFRAAYDFPDYEKKLASGALIREHTRDDILKIVDDNLSQGKITAIDFNLDDFTEADPKVPGDHSAVIVARKKEAGTCMYFMRNSYGAGRDYLPKFRDRYEQGGIWFKKEELPSVYGAVWLK